MQKLRSYGHKLMESRKGGLVMERQRDAATIELLKNLRIKLFSENISMARVAAYNLSWLQEDGLTILKESLFGDYSKTVKKAAAYGLRNMKGRMRKLAIEVLEQGQKNTDKVTREACAKSLYLLHNKPAPKKFAKKKTPGKPVAKGHPRQPIKDVPGKNGKPQRRYDKRPFNR